jgi:hypothetical protein
MTATDTTPRHITVRTIRGYIAAAFVGGLIGVGITEVTHLMRWTKVVPLAVSGLLGLWLLSVGADRLYARIRRAR